MVRLLIHKFAEPGIRRFGRINWLGLWTLYQKEVRRFLKVWTQTLMAPAITTLLFMAIFSIALGGAGRVVSGMEFPRFLAPGLMIMAIVQNAFQNTQSSILLAKIQGNIIDVLMPPLSAGELVVGFTLGAVTRALLVGATVWLAFYLAPDIEVSIAHPWAVAYFAVSAAVLLSLVGILTAIWADKFDHAAAISNFVIVPLSLLSGTFYSIERLPEAWQIFSRVNPFFYLIDGYRYGFIDRADSDIVTGAIALLVLNLLLWAICHYVLRRGYRLKP